MSEGDMTVIEPEMMKSYIWLQTTDGSIQQVVQEVAMYCPMICKENIQKGMGASKNHAISLPERVGTAMLSLILDYCRFHQVPGRSNKECKAFDEKYIRMDTKLLCELTSAADSLQLKPLVDLTSRALARIIEGKTPEEIREIFHLPDDLTEEEKLEPLKNSTDDPRIRLLNRLYARKRRELQEREKLKVSLVFDESKFKTMTSSKKSKTMNVQLMISCHLEEEQNDERSIDDLLSFINGEIGVCSSNEQIAQCTLDTNLFQDCISPHYTASLEVRKLCFTDSKGIKTSKNKKKNRRRKDQQKSTCLYEANEFHEVSSNLNFACPSDELNKFTPSSSLTLKLQDLKDDRVEDMIGFDEGDIDDEIDPALKEKIDREVEDFARRLNSDWPERMQEILSLGQERRPVPFSINGNSSFRRYACMTTSRVETARTKLLSATGWNNFDQMLTGYQEFLFSFIWTQT
ncbi:hypothetical protein TB1_000714 [Malus domestica]